MRLVIGVVLSALVPAPILAQGAPPYTSAENPYQAEFAYSSGKPIDLHVVVAGIRLDTLTVAVAQQPEGETQAPCSVELAGSSIAERKVTLSVVVMLEDSQGMGLDRAELDPFKVKAGRKFDEAQTRPVGLKATAATKLYLLVQVSS